MGVAAGLVDRADLEGAAEAGPGTERGAGPGGPLDRPDGPARSVADPVVRPGHAAPPRTPSRCAQPVRSATVASATALSAGVLETGELGAGRFGFGWGSGPGVGSIDAGADFASARAAAPA